MERATPQPMVDALAKLEMAMRPQSVPSWLSSDTNHAPKVTALGPRRSNVEYMDNPSSAKKNAPPAASLTSVSEVDVAANASGPSVSSVRPRAPIMIQKELLSESQDKAFLSKESVLASAPPKRSSRHRMRGQQQQSSTGSDLHHHRTSRRVKQSLTESLRSLEFFDKTNRSRELSAKYSVMRTQADPEGNIHFVNIDDEGDMDDVDDVSVANEDDEDSDHHHHHSLDAFASPTTTRHHSQNSKAAVYERPSLSPSTTSTAPTATSKPTGSSGPSMKAATPTPPATTDMFRIPELPRGQHLVINILSTWGDPFYVGLMGVELFDHTGHAVHLCDADKQLSADPPDLNAVDHDRVDPRTVDKLMDGCYFTNDELHAWLAPFTRGQNHFVFVDFDDPLSLSMIRIWNYNTTRIHSYRGARYVEISLDNKPIFKGEISRAPGSVTEDVETCHECILFTTNVSILRLIEKYEKPICKTQTTAMAEALLPMPVVEERPKTGNRATRSGHGLGVGTGSASGGTPTVFPLSSVPKPGKAQALSLVAHPSSISSSSRPCTAPIVCSDGSLDKPVACQRISIAFEANWGDPYDVGLAGLQFLDNNYAPLKLSLGADSVKITAPYAQERAERLVVTHGARHLSTNGDDMWSAPLRVVAVPSSSSSSSSSSIEDGDDDGRRLVVDFGHTVLLRALKVWNYNKTLDESFKGAKQITVYLDHVRHSTMSLRKAPGNIMDFDFGQFLYLKGAQQQPQHLHASSPLAAASPATHASVAVAATTTTATAEVLSVHSPGKPDVVRREEDTQSSSMLQLSPSPHHHHHSTSASMRPIAEVFQQYQTPLFPTGYIIKFVFLSTWGDTFYVGLNGLELYDRSNNLVELRDDMLDAQPRDINILKDPGAPHDVRTLDKLFDGVNNTYDDRHMWLTPFTPSPQHNKLVLFFNEPVALSRIRLWNYSKTPSRGVREYEVFMDDVLIFHGILKQAPALQPTSQDDHEDELLRLTRDVGENRRLRKKRYDRAEALAAEAQMTQTILFTNDPEICEAEMDNLYVPEDELEESVTFYDNSQVLSLSDTPQRENLVRPTTSAGGAGDGGGMSSSSGSSSSSRDSKQRVYR